jgi:hypothetical protein
LPNLLTLSTCCVCLEPRPLPSAGVTQLHRYYGPIRHPRMPDLSVTGVRLVVPDHTLGFPVLRALSLCTCCHHYPGAATVFVFAQSHSRVSLPRFAFRVDLRIDLFEVCSVFTRVAACTLALSPYFVTTITRRLQPCRYLHNRSGCYWLEPWPGGTLTHRKAPHLHGARRYRSVEAHSY